MRCNFRGSTSGLRGRNVVVVVVVVVVRRRFATSTGENRLSLSTVVRLTHFWTGVKLEEVCVAQASSFLCLLPAVRVTVERKRSCNGPT